MNVRWPPCLGPTNFRCLFECKHEGDAGGFSEVVNCAFRDIIWLHMTNSTIINNASVAGSCAKAR